MAIALPIEIPQETYFGSVVDHFVEDVQYPGDPGAPGVRATKRADLLP